MLEKMDISGLSISQLVDHWYEKVSSCFGYFGDDDYSDADDQATDCDVDAEVASAMKMDGRQEDEDDPNDGDIAKRIIHYADCPIINSYPLQGLVIHLLYAHMIVLWPFQGVILPITWL